jgi:hypothetical protein
MTREPNALDGLASVAMIVVKVAVLGILAFEAYAFWVMTP